MVFWWVNHKQTYRQETDGGYLWSPKANANGAKNISYDNLTRSSHIKPWRSCDNAERLSGANSLLLSPHIDKLFDRYWISFEPTGELLCEHEIAKEALRCWGIKGANLIRPFNREQESFLKGHREQLRIA